MGIDVTQWRIEIARYWKFAGRRRHGRGKSPGAKAASGTSCSPLLALLLSFCLITAPSLLLQAGDVERNPGPPKIQSMELSIKDLGMLCEAMFEARTKCYDIGVMLKVSVVTLYSIMTQYDDPGDKLREVLKTWLRTAPKPTWQDIVDALKSPVVDELRLARDIEAKYRHLSTEETAHELPQQPTRAAHLGVNDLYCVLEELWGVSPTVWVNIGLNLQLSVSTVEDVVYQYRYQSPSASLHKMLYHWLRTANPPPTWERLARALESHHVGEPRLAEQLRAKYCRTEGVAGSQVEPAPPPDPGAAQPAHGRSSGGDSSSEDKKLLKEAMKEGYISASFLKVIFTGAGGVGKTHTLSLIRGVPPPSSRESTDCANKAVTLRVDAANDKKWEEIGVEKRKEIIAKGICAAKEQNQLEPIPEPQKEKTQIQPEPKSKRTVQQQPHSQADLKLSTPVSSQPLETELDLMKIVNELKSGEIGGKLLELKWVYAVDTGGQPPFHELLSAFIKGASVCAFVVKLSETLAHRPQVEYWVDGTRVGRSFQHPLSNLEILEQSIQTIQVLPNISNEYGGGESSESPLLLVIGTHRDKQTECNETLDRKEEILGDVMKQPGFDLRFNTHSEGEGGEESEGGAQKIIFDVNALNPEQKDLNKAATLRRVIASKMPPLIDIPLRHFCLELELERLATTEPVITMTKCKKIGQRLNFDDTGLKAALRFLHRLNILLYYPKCKEVEELIFCDPLVLIKVVSKVVKLIHMGETRQWKESGKSGLITVEQLNCTEFNCFFQCEIFTCERLFKLYKYLLIVAEVEENKRYFMPCLLNAVKITDLEQMRPKSYRGPLVYKFLDETRNFLPVYAPSGLFSALVAFLMDEVSKVFSKVKLQSSDTRYRNNINFQFQSPPVHFTLLNFRKSFEVFARCLPEHLPKIRNIIQKGLAVAKQVRNFEHVNYKEAFPCKCPNAIRKPHLANIDFEVNSWSCPDDPTKHGQLERTELEWDRELTLKIEEEEKRKAREEEKRRVREERERRAREEERRVREEERRAREEERRAREERERRAREEEERGVREEEEEMRAREERERRENAEVQEQVVIDTPLLQTEEPELLVKSTKYEGSTSQTTLPGPGSEQLPGTPQAALIAEQLAREREHNIRPREEGENVVKKSKRRRGERGRKKKGERGVREENEEEGRRHEAEGYCRQHWMWIIGVIIGVIVVVLAISGAAIFGIKPPPQDTKLSEEVRSSGTVTASETPLFGDKPSMVTLEKFPGKKHQFNILENIGTHYRSFGIQLLDDHNGMKVSEIETSRQRVSSLILQDIFQEWLLGRGKQPVTYTTLVECLRAVDLNVLADDIEEVLQ